VAHSFFDPQLVKASGAGSAGTGAVLGSLGADVPAGFGVDDVEPLLVLVEFGTVEFGTVDFGLLVLGWVAAVGAGRPTATSPSSGVAHAAVTHARAMRTGRTVRKRNTERKG
jgi:hypothetical protein